MVCGRGGSATTRYVDLVVGLEADDGEGGATMTQQEFSNIDREALPGLQVNMFTLDSPQQGYWASIRSCCYISITFVLLDAVCVFRGVLRRYRSGIGNRK